MTAVFEISVNNVSAPSIGEPSEPQPQPDQPPLNLTVVISETGYTVIAAGQPVEGRSGGASGPTFPLIERSFVCSRFRGTTPPPRSKNMDRAPCDPNKPLEERPFVAYDVRGLTDKLIEIKNLFPDERRIIVQAEPTTQYEALVDVIDASREARAVNGDVIALFDEVMVSPSPL